MMMAWISTGVFVLCAVALVVAGRLIRKRDGAAATVTAMFDLLMSRRAVAFAVIVIWWWLGWHFFAGHTL